MNQQTTSKIRLAVNGVICIALGIACLAYGLPGTLGLLTGARHFGADPDGGDKVLAIQLFSDVVGVMAVGSIVSTVRAWRRLDR